MTAKWKKQDVYIAVTNIAGLFGYSLQDLVLRHVFQLYTEKSLHNKQLSIPSDDDLSRSLSPVSPKQFSDKELLTQFLKLPSDFVFSCACCLTFSTLALILQHIGDENVLFYIHILFVFLSTAVSISYVSALLCDIALWPEIIAFFNALLRSERHEPLITSNLFPN